MRILLDLVHPADALFFFHAMKALEADGADIRIVSRRKDVLTDILDELRLEHEPITTAATGRLGQAIELLQRDTALFRIARGFKPDIMAGFGGVAISHVGKLLGIPSLSFYDTEHAGLQLGLTMPFISEWHVPESWNGAEVKGRTFRFPGSKQFAYLHPDHFTPDPAIARAAGWDPARDNFLIRIVAWRANHDAGRSGIPPSQVKDIVGLLGERGKVHISSESALPAELEALRYAGSPVAFHHLLAHCRLYCGESITVASEATALGVPTLLQIDKEYSYVATQEQAGLIERFTPSDPVRPILEDVLQRDIEAFRTRARAFASVSGDLNAYIVAALRRAAGNAQ